MYVGFFVGHITQTSLVPTANLADTEYNARTYMHAAANIAAAYIAARISCLCTLLMTYTTGTPFLPAALPAVGTRIVCLVCMQGQPRRGFDVSKLEGNHTGETIAVQTCCLSAVGPPKPNLGVTGCHVLHVCMGL